MAAHSSIAGGVLRCARIFWVELQMELNVDCNVQKIVPGISSVIAGDV